LTRLGYPPVLVAMQHKSSTSVISIPATNPARRILLALALGVFALIGAGCQGDQIETTKRLVEQQQSQLEHQQQEIEALKANQNLSYTPGVAASSRGGCDKGVETAASQRGGDRFSAADFSKALEYYQDALSTCPTDARAEVNVARTYEALGNKVAAINHYRKAADRSGPTVSDASEEARAALERMQASRLP
jgi:tetratricopeptide (TPR) repeat protein